MNKTLHSVFHVLLPWLLLVVLGGILLILNNLSGSLNESERNRVEQRIHQIQILDTQINFDVLRLRYRQLLTYDSLGVSSGQIEHLLAQLNDSFAGMEIPEALKDSHESWQNKTFLLDDFRRQNTVLNNSIYHFINLSRQLQTSKDARLKDSVSAITRDMLVFVNENNVLDAPVILNELSQLENMSSGLSEHAVQAQLFAAHGKQIVENLLPVAGQMLGISYSGFSLSLEDAYTAYTRIYSQKLAQAEKFRRLMALFSFLMVASVVTIMWRLQQTAQELEKSHALLDNIADHLSEGILSFDAEGNLNFINQRAEIILGRAEAELLGTDLADIWPRSQIAHSLFRASLKTGKPYEGEEWLQRANGEQFPAAFLGGPLPEGDDAKAAGYVTSFRDITLQRQAEARLRIAARVFDNISQAIMIAGQDGVIQSANAAFTKITGYSEQEAIGKTPGKLLASGLHDQDFYRMMWKQLMEEGGWEGEIVNRRKNG
ncbi:MAG: PAS domain S-box protein, partial [Zoogloeaceae bacterium]|nr:PAS domain S-box protein [Zoogloeaceae bacterium]